MGSKTATWHAEFNLSWCSSPAPQSPTHNKRPLRPRLQPHLPNTTSLHMTPSIQQTLSTRLKTTVQLLHPWVMPLRRRRWSCTTTKKKTDLLRTDISRATPRKKPRKSWSVWTLTRMARFLSRRSRLISKRCSCRYECTAADVNDTPPTQFSYVFLERDIGLVRRNSTLTTCSKEPRQAQHPPLALLRIFKNWLMMMRKNFWRISTKTRMVTFPSRN